MTKKLVIVESPAKAKTIGKYLGEDFEVLASYGHVRDLIPKNGAVDVDHNFSMHYAVIEKNAKYVNAIAKALKNSTALYLATDPDREGEAIAWHLCELMKEKKILKNKPIYRVAFHEITKSAIQEALAHPRAVAMELVDAQQARRALDYLVGFNLSPLLWKKICYGLSAGRVQSPALRMIVEREAEIEQFKPQEYWTLWANASHKAQKFGAKLSVYQHNKLTQFSITNAEQAHGIEQELLEQAAGKLKVIKVEKKQRKRNPAPPFTTSTLQQEAARKLGFTAQRTMRTAQQLYEGIAIGKEGHVGLITYMRTDSVNLAKEAIAEIRAVIKKKFGAANLPEHPHFYKTKSKNAQEAHEAIRPTLAARTPESCAAFLNIEQLRLYTLIWKRTMACQMVHATIDTVAVDLQCGVQDGNSNKSSKHDKHSAENSSATIAITPANVFRANGSTIVDLGFMTVYREGHDDDAGGGTSGGAGGNENSNGGGSGDGENTGSKKIEDKYSVVSDATESLLPIMNEGDIVELVKIVSEQHFTEPPPRYTEASLIKTLEEYGIGRPSTYATIIQTLLARKYTLLESKRFKPTDMGRLVNRFLTNYFATYVDYDFTAKLEDKLDDVARGENHYVPLLREFWQPFKASVDDAGIKVSRKDARQELLDRVCPQCGKPLALRLSKNGAFVGCTGFPECTYTESLDKSKPGKDDAVVTAASAEEEKKAQEIIANRQCPLCGQTLALKVGKYGKFIGCSNYPNCKFMESLNKPTDTGIACPQCKQANLIKRKSRYGTYFYACANYPKCKYAISAEPIVESCPKCNWPILMLKITKRRGMEKMCPQKECGYVEQMQASRDAVDNGGDDDTPRIGNNVDNANIDNATRSVVRAKSAAVAKGARKKSASARKNSKGVKSANGKKTTHVK